MLGLMRACSMKRLRAILRIAGAGAIVLSALLCLVSLGMWVRSYIRQEEVSHFSVDRDGWTRRFMFSGNGIIGAGGSRVTFGELPGYTPPTTGWRYDLVVMPAS